MPLAPRTSSASGVVRLARWSALAITAALLTTSGVAQKRKSVAAAEGENPKNVPSYYGAQPAAENIDLTMYARIRTEAFQHGKAMQFSEALMDGIGPRLTGSPNMAKANAWTRDTMTAIGLSNAHLEDWGDFGMGWQQINTWARMVGPDPEPLWLQAAPWSPATSSAVTGEILYLPLRDQSDLDKAKGNLKGKIVLLGAMRPTPDITEPLFHRYTDAELKEMEGSEELGSPRRSAAAPPTQTREQLLAARRRLTQLRQDFLKEAAQEGVLAIITPSRDGGEGGGTGIIYDDNGANLAQAAQKPENAVKIPNAVMMIEHYNRLARMATAHVPVTVEVDIETKFTGDHEHGFDTVAEIPGTDPKLKDEVVMVGGHLDSWISGTGATDNGAGSVMAMEAMRILKALNVQPRRTLRIALWSGEEQGPVRFRRVRAAAFRDVCCAQPAGSCRHARLSWPPWSADHHQGVGEAGRVLQPGQRHGQGARRVHAGELRRWADLQAVDPSPGRSRREHHQLSQHGRYGPPELRCGGSAGLPVHPGPDGL